MAIARSFQPLLNVRNADFWVTEADDRKWPISDR